MHDIRLLLCYEPTGDDVLSEGRRDWATKLLSTEEDPVMLRCLRCPEDTVGEEETARVRRTSGWTSFRISISNSVQ